MERAARPDNEDTRRRIAQALRRVDAIEALVDDALMPRVPHAEAWGNGVRIAGLIEESLAKRDGEKPKTN